MQNFGFVYIWRDRKHKRYYVGSHWGAENDGYVCSSTWMKNSYKRRPEDFKKRIISLVYTNRKDLLEEESYWLEMIKDEDLGKRYYNLNNKMNGHWSTDDNKRMTVGQKISLAPGRKEKIKERAIARAVQGLSFSELAKARQKESMIGFKHTQETIEKIRSKTVGQKRSEDQKVKMSNSMKGIKKSEEHKAKQSLVMKGKNKGQVRSEETKLKMSQNRTGKGTGMVSVTDKLGINTFISKSDYDNQKLLSKNPEDWEYVSVTSNEAKRRWSFKS